jgi:hypothetical protein
MVCAAAASTRSKGRGVDFRSILMIVAAGLQDAGGRQKASQRC